MGMLWLISISIQEKTLGEKSDRGFPYQAHFRENCGGSSFRSFFLEEENVLDDLKVVVSSKKVVEEFTPFEEPVKDV